MCVKAGNGSESRARKVYGTEEPHLIEDQLSQPDSQFQEETVARNPSSGTGTSAVLPAKFRVLHREFQADFERVNRGGSDMRPLTAVRTEG